MLTRLAAFGFLMVFAALPAPAGADTRLARVQQAGELRVCIWPQYFAISFRNPRTGRLEGIDITLAEAAAQALGVRVRWVETSFAAFMDRLEQDSCDVAAFGIGITEARAARIDFTAPHLASAVYAVTTQTNARIRAWADIDRPGHVVAVAAGTVMEPLMRESLRAAELLVVRPPHTREAEVESGRADVFMSDFPYTRRMVTMHAWARVIDPPDGFGTTRYAWAVARGQPEWRARLDAILAALRQNGRLAEAARAHGLEPILLR